MNGSRVPVSFLANFHPPTPPFPLSSPPTPCALDFLLKAAKWMIQERGEHSSHYLLSLLVVCSAQNSCWASCLWRVVCSLAFTKSEWFLFFSDLGVQSPFFIHLNIYAYIYKYIYICTCYIFMFLYIFVHVYRFKHLCLYICFLNMFIYVNIYVYIYLYMFIYLSFYLYLYVFIYFVYIYIKQINI